MSYDPAVLRRATARLEGERRAREEQQQALRRAACQRQPRLSEIDRQLRGTMTELFAASLRRGEGGAPTVEEVRRKNLALQQERAELLARMDLAEDALDDKPACPLCGDTGWRGTEMCRCLRALCAQEQIRELSKLLDLGEQSFDTFRMDYYSTSFWPEWGTSPRENMELVYEVCLNYAQKFGRFYFKNLFLSGAPGWARPSCLPASPALCRRTDIRWCMTQRGTCSRSSRPGSSSGTATTAGRPGTRPGAIWAVTC